MQEEIIVTQMQDMPPMAQGIGVGFIVAMLVVYVFWAWCMGRIAWKMGLPFGSSLVWALIPIANFFLILKLAEKPYWWFILMLIPIVNLVIMILVWMAICERLGKPTWWGVCIALVPILNIVLFLILVFEGKKAATATA